MGVLKKLGKPFLAGLDAFLREIPVVGKVYSAVADSLNFRLPDVTGGSSSNEADEPETALKQQSPEAPVKKPLDIEYTDV